MEAALHRQGEGRKCRGKAPHRGHLSRIRSRKRGNSKDRRDEEADSTDGGAGLEPHGPWSLQDCAECKVQEQIEFRRLLLPPERAAAVISS